MMCPVPSPASHSATGSSPGMEHSPSPLTQEGRSQGPVPDPLALYSLGSDHVQLPGDPIVCPDSQGSFGKMVPGNGKGDFNRGVGLLC